MIPARAAIALAGWLAIGATPAASQQRAFFKDTALVTVSRFEARSFDLRQPAQRDSFRAVLKQERERWRAQAPKNYRYLLQSGCFCPGQRGWLLVEVRSGQPLKAWDRKGKVVALTDWDTVTIDKLFDNLDKSVDLNGMVQVGFDPRWHFPAYVYTVRLPGPDMWSVTEARALRPM